MNLSPSKVPKQHTQNFIMDEHCITRLQSDWYSPTRLHNSPVDYDFPGDRFIPNRSLMNLDHAHSLLTSKNKERDERNSSEYIKKLKENLVLDIEGRPFRMLVFRGSPKSSRKSTRHIDEMRRSDGSICSKRYRELPKKASRILDAPNIKDNYYFNILDWGKCNILAVALGSGFYLWNADNANSLKLSEGSHENDYPTSVAWSQDAKIIAAGHMSSKLQLWDAHTSKIIRCLGGHKKRVGSIAWNGNILTSGSYDKAIINHDVRARNSLISCMRVHTEEVCGLKWSRTGNILASGGNDNLLHIWDASKMSSMHYVYRFNDHKAAVKALAWSPYNFDVLATGGGTNDGCIKIWNIQKGTCTESIDTKSQISGLLWNRHYKEILCGHGFGWTSEFQNQLSLWKYPSLTRVGTSLHHNARVHNLSQSPDGSTVVSAGADETLRFWEVFGMPKTDNSRISGLDSMLSLKTSPIR